MSYYIHIYRITKNKEKQTYTNVYHKKILKKQVNRIMEESNN